MTNPAWQSPFDLYAALQQRQVGYSTGTGWVPPLLEVHEYAIALLEAPQGTWIGPPAPMSLLIAEGG